MDRSRCGRRHFSAAAAVAVSLLVATGAGATASESSGLRVWYVSDGDTLRLTNGARVRLVQIDSPEVGTGECYSRAAARALRRLVPEGTEVTLEADPVLDKIDRHGRLLRYVRHGGANVNLEMVGQGAATVWFYDGDRGRYAQQFLRAARAARVARRGLWGACRTVWDPQNPAASTSLQPATPNAGSTLDSCDDSYPDVCIPPPPPDLDCANIPHRNFRVRPPDPHRFDGNHDGRGCES